MTKIAVLMTCYNRVYTTLECLKRLFSQEMPTGFSFDVWLVDDASPDKTGEKVSLAYPSVNVIQGNGKLFWSKGMRLAWDKAADAYDYDYYLWLNDDVMLVDRHVFASIIEDIVFLEKNKTGDYVLVGTCASDNTLKELVYGCYRSVEVLRPNGRPQSADSYMMSGNIVIVPKCVYRRIGPIYNGYSHAYGDGDYRQLLLKNHIGLYCASKVCGVCPKEPERYIRLKGKGLFKRINILFMAKGLPLRDTFIYRYRHWGLMRALLSVCHVIFKALFEDWR